MTPPPRVLASLPTPFDEQGRLDLPALDHLVGYACERGPSGLALLTEAAEVAFLDPSEQRSIVERVAARAREAKPFWVQVGAPWTRGAMDAAQHAEGLGAAGLLLSVPRLPDVGYEEVYRHVDRIARGTTAPLVLVARPGDLVSSLAPEEQAALVKHERLAGVLVAEGAGDAQLRAWARRLRGRAPLLFAACAFEMLDAARAGATGAVCGLALLAPGPAQSVAEALEAGAIDGLRKLQRRLQPALDRLGPPRAREAATGIERIAERLAHRPLDGGRLRPVTPPGLLKEGLRLQGHRLKSFVRPPQAQVTDEERDRLKAALRAAGMLA